MSSPVYQFCTANTWKLVASNVTSCEIKKYFTGVEYLVAIREHGDDAPTRQTQGSKIFINSDTAIISNENYIDIYIFAIDENGKVLIDTGGAPSIGQSLSLSNDAILTTSYSDDYTVRGDAFNISTILTVASGVTVKCALDFSGVTTDREIFLLPLTFASSAGYFKGTTYNITTYTGGTSVPFINLNENSLNAALSVFKTGVASTDTAGNDKREYVIGGGANPASSRGGSGGSSNQIWVKRGVKKVIELKNTTNASADIQISIVLVEARQKTN